MVYLYLATVSEAEPQDIKDALRMGKLSLYPVLDTLVERDLLDVEGTEYFTVQRREG